MGFPHDFHGIAILRATLMARAELHLPHSHTYAARSAGASNAVQYVRTIPAKKKPAVLRRMGHAVGWPLSAFLSSGWINKKDEKKGCTYVLGLQSSYGRGSAASGPSYPSTHPAMHSVRATHVH